MSRASRSLAFALAFVAACVGTNPDWDGPIAAESSSALGDSSEEVTSDGVSSDASATATGSDSQGTSSDSRGTTGVVDACVDGAQGAGECPPSCAGGCASGECLLACMGMSCKDTAIECPPGWPCRVECDGKDRCKGSTIDCPPGHACAITCTSEHACEDLVVTCGDGPCAMDCLGSGDPCNKARLTCGAAEGRVTCSDGHPEPPSVSGASSSCACDVDGCEPTGSSAGDGGDD